MPGMFTTQNDAHRRHARRLSAVAALIGLLLSVAPGGSLASTTSAVPAFDHVFVIVMENHSYSQIIGNTSQAPYINQLASQYGLATNYFAVTHPSLPNYLALIGGSTFGITSDCANCFVNAPNLAADRISPSGRSWKGYMESTPSPCFVGDSGLYVQKHNPFIYFDTVRTNPTQCANIVPFAELGVDLTTTATTPGFVWITPNLCSDMHDCSISTGDTWLKNNVVPILNSPAYTNQNSVMFIVWDEDNGSQGNQVANLVISKSVPAGFRSNVAYTHYSLLRTIEDAWGLAPLTANDGNASAMGDFFGSRGAADTSPPSQPGPITVSSITQSSASLKWGGSTDDVGIEGYRVYRGPAGAAQSALSLIATTDAVTSYSATHLYSGTGYTFGVVAIDAANNKSLMRTVTLTTATSTDTTAPSSSTSVSGRVFSSSRIDLFWAASTSTDVAGYNVYRDGTQVATVNLPNGPRYSDNGLAASSSHVYTLSAVDSAGNLSAATSGRTLNTLAAGALIVARGPYLSNVTGTSAVVSWWTNLPTPGVVAWGIATPTENSINDPAGTVQHHSVIINGLSQGTPYKYRVGDGAGLASGATFSTAVTPGQTFTFAAIGDFGGGGTGETQTANTIATAGTAFVQTVGDNIYPTAGLPDPDFNSIYSDFDQRLYKPFAAVINSQSFFPANGNQEYYGDGAFWDNFPMPGANHSYYSYDWGDAHMLVLDSEQPMAPSSAQYQFAQSDLAAHQASAWRIAIIQRPPYSSSSTNSSSDVVRNNLVPLFQQQHVSLVLSGNSHNYERTFPLIDSVPATGGVTYIVSGAWRQRLQCVHHPPARLQRVPRGDLLRVHPCHRVADQPGRRRDPDRHRRHLRYNHDPAFCCPTPTGRGESNQRDRDRRNHVRERHDPADNDRQHARRGGVTLHWHYQITGHRRRLLRSNLELRREGRLRNQRLERQGRDLVA